MNLGVLTIRYRVFFSPHRPKDCFPLWVKSYASETTWEALIPQYHTACCVDTFVMASCFIPVCLSFLPLSIASYSWTPFPGHLAGCPPMAIAEPPGHLLHTSFSFFLYLPVQVILSCLSLTKKYGVYVIYIQGIQQIVSQHT